jgi:hypothetical protein
MKRAGFLSKAGLSADAGKKGEAAWAARGILILPAAPNAERLEREANAFANEQQPASRPV